MIYRSLESYLDSLWCSTTFCCCCFYSFVLLLLRSQISKTKCVCVSVVVFIVIVVKITKSLISHATRDKRDKRASSIYFYSFKIATINNKWNKTKPINEWIAAHNAVELFLLLFVADWCGCRRQAVMLITLGLLRLLPLCLHARAHTHGLTMKLFYFLLWNFHFLNIFILIWMRQIRAHILRTRACN